MVTEKVRPNIRHLTKEEKEEADFLLRAAGIPIEKNDMGTQFESLGGKPHSGYPFLTSLRECVLWQKEHPNQRIKNHNLYTETGYDLGGFYARVRRGDNLKQENRVDACKKLGLL